MTAPPLPSTVEPPERAGRPHAEQLPAAAGGGVVDFDALLGPYLERELLVTGTGNLYRYGDTTDTSRSPGRTCPPPPGRSSTGREPVTRSAAP